MKAHIFSVLLLSLIISFNSCEKVTENAAASDDENGISHEDSADYIWDANAVISILLNNTSISCSSANVTVDGTLATITGAGTYNISGTLADGRILVDAGSSDVIRLILDGVTINSSAGPAIWVEKSQKTIINLSAGSQNLLTDGTNYSGTEDYPNSTLYSQSDLTIFGEGALSVNGNYEDGISSKDGLIIKSGTITVTAADDGIRGKDYAIVEGGSITIASGGDGLKSDNEELTTTGYVSMLSGTLNITSAGDGISAYRDVNISGGSVTIVSGGGSSHTVSGDLSAKGIKGQNSVTLAAATFSVNSADDAIHSNNKVEIKSGTFSISTADDAIHADNSIMIQDGDIDVGKCYEGVESHTITVNGGTIGLISSDDSFNATAGSRTEQNDNSFIYINGGTISLNGSAGDPLDSNGSIEMNAGTVIIHGPSSQPEVGIDYNGTFNITGGLLVASGPSSNMTQGLSSSSTQNSIKVMLKTSVSGGQIFHVQDSDGNEVLTFEPVRKYQAIVFSSPLLVKGETYSIYKSGSSTGTAYKGLYSNGIYTPGTLLGSFTVTGIVTNVTNF